MAVISIYRGVARSARGFAAQTGRGMASEVFCKSTTRKAELRETQISARLKNLLFAFKWIFGDSRSSAFQKSLGKHSLWIFGSCPLPSSLTEFVDTDGEDNNHADNNLLHVGWPTHLV